MARYIDADALLKDLETVTNDETCPTHIAAYIEQIISVAPTADVVKVVRCRNCEYYGECSVQEIRTLSDNDYCSWGIQKHERMKKMTEQDNVLRAEAARLGELDAYADSEIEIPCPVCGGHNFDYVIEDNQGNIVGCENCCKRIYYEELEEGVEFG